MSIRTTERQTIKRLPPKPVVWHLESGTLTSTRDDFLHELSDDVGEDLQKD